MKKRIVITQRVIPSEQGAPRDGLEQDYVLYYESFDISLIPMPNVLRDPSGWLKELKPEACIISGGNDVNPTRYGAEPAPTSTHADERDATEEALLMFASTQKIPVLSECRGTQFLNVH